MLVKPIPKLIVFLLLLISFQVKSQRVLALDKSGKTKRIRYYKGDMITLKLDTGTKFSGEITLLMDSSFWVGSKQIKLSDIKYIQKTKSGYGWKLLSQISFTAANAYFLIDTGNRLINNDQPMVHEGTLKASGIMYGVFFISSSIANRKYRINKKRTLKVIDLSL